MSTYTEQSIAQLSLRVLYLEFQTALYVLVKIKSRCRKKFILIQKGYNHAQLITLCCNEVTTRAAQLLLKCSVVPILLEFLSL